MNYTSSLSQPVVVAKTAKSVAGWTWSSFWTLPFPSSVAQQKVNLSTSVLLTEKRTIRLASDWGEEG